MGSQARAPRAPNVEEADPRAPLVAKQRVVVAGAGFAGLNVAKELEDDCDVTLVAPTDRFVYLPLIHEVVSENVTPSEVTRRLADVLPHTTLVHGRALMVQGRELVTAAGERLPFDKLVVAVGAEPNDFGVKGVREHALTFYSVGEALRANATLKMLASQIETRPVRVVAAGARRAEDQDARRPAGPLRVVVVGAGFTGVEVAGEVAELLDKLDVPRDVSLLDAMPDIFPRQGAAFRKKIKEAIDEQKLRLTLGRKIVEVRVDAVVVDGAPPVPSDITFWCAGIKPRAVEGVDPNVRPTLQSAKDDAVFVVGDAARFPRELGVPQLAQTAEDQAKVVAWNVLYPERMRAYEPDVKGIIVSVGHDNAVAELKGGIVLTGRIPWHVKRRLYKAKIALA
jgi:NADH dehydrogenase